jgi:hypothetical protein
MIDWPAFRLWERYREQILQQRIGRVSWTCAHTPAGQTISISHSLSSSHGPVRQWTSTRNHLLTPRMEPYSNGTSTPTPL